LLDSLLQEINIIKDTQMKSLDGVYDV